LDRFVRARDQAAFEALLRRHGPMILSVCRSLLRDPHHVEDAFQDTFLVLITKAGSIRKREAVGSWLYRVAYHVAVRANIRANRIRLLQHEMVDKLTEIPDDGEERERSSLLHEELRRLPDKHRMPLALCYLKSKTHAAAARELNCP